MLPVGCIVYMQHVTPQHRYRQPCRPGGTAQMNRVKMGTYPNPFRPKYRPYPALYCPSQASLVYTAIFSLSPTAGTDSDSRERLSWELAEPFPIASPLPQSFTDPRSDTLQGGCSLHFTGTRSCAHSTAASGAEWRGCLFVALV